MKTTHLLLLPLLALPTPVAAQSIWLGAGESRLHQLGLFGDVKLGGVRPGLYLRVPLDHEMRETIDWVVGLQLQVDVR
jgi:hypothetical protein